MEKNTIESIHTLPIETMEEYLKLLKTQVKCNLILSSKSPFITAKKKVAAELHKIAEKSNFDKKIYGLLDYKTNEHVFETHEYIIKDSKVHAIQYKNRKKIQLNKTLSLLLRAFNEKRILCDILKSKTFVRMQTVANAIYDMETARTIFLTAFIKEYPYAEQAHDIKFQTHEYIIMEFNEGEK